jgi:hypothetical protein
LRFSKNSIVSISNENNGFDIFKQEPVRWENLWMHIVGIHTNRKVQKHF